MVVQSLHCVDNSENSSPKGKVEAAVVSTRRRVSARIQSTKLRAEKEKLVRKRVELLDENEGGGDGKKRTNVYTRRRVNVENLTEEVVLEKTVSEVVKPAGEAVNLNNGGQNGAVGGSEGVTGGVSCVTEKSAHARVKETLRLFNKHYLHFVQEEETRCQKEEVDKKKASKSKKSKKGNATKVDAKKKAKRPDLKAISKMLETNAIMYPEKKIGDLAGINVGHQFYSRAEMVAVGFHSHWLNGIDYMGMSYSKEYADYTFPLAIAIVLSGMYEDDLDNAEDVIYTGQGGHDLTGNKRQIRDQVMERGNLALKLHERKMDPLLWHKFFKELTWKIGFHFMNYIAMGFQINKDFKMASLVNRQEKNCVEQGVPVRVIRGHESASSYSGKVYTYDGLYKVVQYWAEKGISGFTVFKYRLRRFEGQPILTTNQVQFIYGRVPQSISEIRGLVCEDISGGREDVPIPATNLVDDPPVPPTGFTYRKSLQVSKSIKLPTSAVGCDCKGGCVDPRTCACAQLNGTDFPYVHRDGGRLIEAKAIVYECGPNCGCGPHCVNRTSQRGLKYRFEVFRSPKKGWAVRSWDFIPSGAPICEYVGVLMRTEDLDSVLDNNYIFEIDCLQTMSGLGGRERRLGDVSVPTINNSNRPEDQKSESVPEFCIDAGSTGNIARFINHSCEPNLFVQCVLSSHHDLKLARVMLFAADNIPPLQELTYDYGYALDSVTGPDGKIKQMACYCGAADCRKRLF
ncbi:histone-lysine N-methyltransferase, H3 lysine-9 specific SUVH4 isoform X2 [Jatropha curcas]|uniref:histone-lysine N-methyltransferase, H3 lysine-9 specific SUVH4 isoform X2 n=1 Tax=Jatropha curcas TaxID=180498 RepID=UPI0005FA964E|nr:histone-lysine N-methyltransferase, H3 lysine-9 specific SUVH4 isoform X2 [Jatropha curcas]